MSVETDNHVVEEVVKKSTKVRTGINSISENENCILHCHKSSCARSRIGFQPRWEAEMAKNSDWDGKGRAMLLTTHNLWSYL